MSDYQLVAGLETHMELATETKIFCGCTTKFGAEPNTNCCPICLGMPGTLPILNRQVVQLAIRAGLATHCTISNISKMDRKNYCYPDLPKAYQISQFDVPICQNGYINLSDGRTVRINRIHIEEDAGKLVHSAGTTLVDYNRGGIGLIEIVTEPDFRSVDEVREYLEKLQLIMRSIGVSDCRMEQGSMRCDVNISVRRDENSPYGTRTEIKNMNSFAHIVRAMEAEYERQCDLLDSGETVSQETRRFDEKTGETQTMRSKEDADDYRYFPEPDVVTIEVSDEEIAAVKAALPMLPEERKQMYMESWGLSEADAALLSRHRRVSDYFEAVVHGCKSAKYAANFITGQIFSRLGTEEQKEQMDCPVSVRMLTDLIVLLEDGKIKMNVAKRTLEQMLDTGRPASDFIRESDMGDLPEDVLRDACLGAIEAMPAAVSDYKNGKEKAVKAMIGSVMRATSGKADARKAEELLKALMAD